MISQYTELPINDFNKETLKVLKPYFDINLKTDGKNLWLSNLLSLATQNLGIAHCIQHNATARYLVDVSFINAPTFYNTEFETLIGCYSSVKRPDTLQLDNGVVYGEKHWISNLHVADYGILRIPSGQEEAYVLFDFKNVDHKIKFTKPHIGMEIARPGTLIVNDYKVPPGYILGYRSFADNNSIFVKVLSFMDYCFITNQLGCIIGLYNDLKLYANKKNFEIAFDLNKFKLEIATLKFMWTKNLETVDTVQVDDEFWHIRNTQYTQNKKVLIDLIHLSLQLGDSSWMTSTGNHNQKFRDALVFSTHNRPLYQNTSEKHFIQF